MHALKLQLRTLSSAEDLRRVGAAWDDLWERSDAALPTLKSELLITWLEDFAPRSRLHVLTVSADSRMVAALPLIDLDRGGPLRLGALPKNDWSNSGDLMLDPSVDSVVVADVLVDALRSLPWSLLLLRQVDLDRPAWRAVLASAERKGLAVRRYGMSEVGTIRFPRDADAYLAGRSRRHLKHMRRMERRSDAAGGRGLRIYDSLKPDDVEALLRAGFEMEDRSWKGRAQSSVLRTPNMWRHYLRQARLLAASGQLCLVFLECAGKGIAFEYSFLAKGHYITPKAGYDEAFRDMSPGQLLCFDLYRYMADCAASPVVDLVGPLNDAERCWINDRYRLETLLIAPRSWRGRILTFGVYSMLASRRTLRRIKRSLFDARER